MSWFILVEHEGDSAPKERPFGNQVFVFPVKLGPVMDHEGPEEARPSVTQRVQLVSVPDRSVRDALAQHHKFAQTLHLIETSNKNARKELLDMDGTSYMATNT